MTTHPNTNPNPNPNPNPDPNPNPNPNQAARSSADSDSSFHASEASGGRVVEEALFGLTRCFGDLYAQHHGVSAEPEVLP